MLYAHFDRDKKEGQILYDHLKNVSDLMTERLCYLSFEGIPNEDLKRLLTLVGKYHDLGKATTYFQKYLTKGVENELKSHSFLSSSVFVKMCEDSFSKELIYLGFIAIYNHHGSLSTYFESINWNDLIKQYQNFNTTVKENSFKMDYLDTDRAELEVIGIEEVIKYKKRMTNIRRRTPLHFFVLQYIFSSLICFDKLDSAGINRKKQEELPTIAALDEHILKKSKGRQSNMQNQRNEIKCQVLETIDRLTDEELKNNRIFTFTAPTGAGKTLTSAAAELRLSERLKGIYGTEPNIIVAIPFVNILEQTKEDYNSIFKNVLIHHSLSNLKEYSESDMTNLHEKELLTDTWESNVIMTTFVQFFESILTAKNNRLMKLNKMSGSIVVLDEIQSLPPQYYPLIGAVIKKISDYYGVWFILMTATQPKIIDYANMLLDDSKMSAIELLQDGKRYFMELERTMLIPCFDKLYEIDDIVELIHKTKPCYKNALVVVNTIASSIELYDKLIQEGHRVLYLSTNLISVDRKEVIKDCQKLIEDRVPFILVSTQTIEAGVDLDFDIGYRDLAPLESIIQVAGRVNRNGKKVSHSPVYIFESGKGSQIYKLYRIDKTKKYLSRNIPENEYVNLVDSYYSEMLEDKSYDRDIWEAVQTLNYEDISKFKLIDEQNIRDVIIEKDDIITKALEDYCALRKEYSKSKSYETRDKIKQKTKLINQYTVKVRTKKLVKNMPWQFNEIYAYMDAPYLIVPKPNVSQFYNCTGFISENNDAFFY